MFPSSPSSSFQGPWQATAAERPLGKENSCGAEGHAGDKSPPRQRQRGVARERLVKYVKDIIRRQTIPLNEIVRQEVLPYLPGTALLRSRSVCRSWCSHISTPFFQHRQSNTHRSLSGFFLYHPDGDSRALYLPLSPASAQNLPYPDPLGFLPLDSNTTQAVASSYGLVIAVNSSDRHILWRPAYIVCNPVTAQWARLPRRPEPFHDGVVLIFEPSDLNFFADYLVVSSFRWRDENQEPPKDLRKFVVFCSRTAEWRRISTWTLPGKDTALQSPHGVSAGGKAYWRTAKGRIMSYDPAADAPEVFNAPSEASVDEAVVWQIGELARRLCCVSYDVVQGALAVSTLVRDSGAANSHWEKLRTIHITPFAEVCPLMFHGGDGEVVAWVEGAVVSYKTASGEGRILCEAPVSEFEFLPYISSLVFVKKIDADGHDNYDEATTSPLLG